MYDQTISRPSSHRRLIARIAAAVAATTAFCATSPGTAFAGPAPIPDGPGASTGTAATPSTATVITDSLSTLQVALISLVVSVVVAALVIAVALLVRRHTSRGASTITIPEQRRESAPEQQGASAR
jgi:ABC-type Fe3+ transport system permease subunit